MKETIKANTLANLNQKVHDFIAANLPMADNITIVTSISDGEFVATIVPDEPCEAMKKLLCGEYEMIRVFWTKDDIRGLETDGRQFTEAEVEEIKQTIERRADASEGVNWDVISEIAYEVAPGAFDGDRVDDDPTEDESMDDSSDVWDRIQGNFTPEQ